MRWAPINAIKTDELLAGILPVATDVLGAVVDSMRARGYDEAEPLVIWKERGLLVDGHTRLRAASLAGIPRVYVDERDFEDMRAAVEYAIARQRDRRNLTKAELAGFVARSIEALDKTKPPEFHGNRYTSSGASIEAPLKKSAEETAERIGVSRAQVERTRAVLNSPEEDVKEKLRGGQTTINAAYREVATAKVARQESAPAAPAAVLTPVEAPSLWAPPPKAMPTVRSSYSVAEWTGLTIEERTLIREMAPLSDEGRRANFNQVNENIDWAKWSWNPVTGCLHDCPYCYARDIAERFYTQKFAPTFLPSRLRAAQQTKVPPRDGIGWRNVFVCSMADLFGKWVPQDWIDAVFQEVVAAAQWNFLFLTKFPQRLAEQDWPANAWCGTSVDTQARVANAERSFMGVKAGVKWLSCEPLMERLTFKSLEMFDWVVIGAASQSTKTPEFQPPWEWVEHLLLQARSAGCKVYIKPNLKSRPQEYPCGVQVQP